MQSKPHVIKDFDKLDKELQEKVLQLYPNGFTEFLVTYTDPKTGQERFALPYETEDRYYMIRMDEYIDTDRNTDDDDDFKADDLLTNLGLDSIDKPAELKMDEDEDEETKNNDSEDDDDDDDLENIADEEDEDDEDDNL
ncbi:MAG: hypothetical protein II926_07665 [Bacteroidales bacterium]|nr:hypothetical protein [Bacteroidales bacterium]